MTITNQIREIVLDTETTGLSPLHGDKIVEIGCLELINHVPTGKFYQAYINPEREMSQGASAVSGITDELLIDKPIFADIVDDFLHFIQDSTLVIHNAKFDIGFLNSEMAAINKPLFELDKTIDTLLMARRKFPGSPASLDALCKRFDISTADRTVHGAIIDCKLLADVYINLLGDKQSTLLFAKNAEDSLAQAKLKQYPERSFPVSREEEAKHKDFVENEKLTAWADAS